MTNTHAERLARLNQLNDGDDEKAFKNAAPVMIEMLNDLAADNERLRALLEECEGALNSLVRHADKGLGAIAPDVAKAVGSVSPTQLNEAMKRLRDWAENGSDYEYADNVWADLHGDVFNVLATIAQLWADNERWRARCVAAENGHPQVKEAVAQQAAIIEQQRADIEGKLGAIAVLNTAVDDLSAQVQQQREEIERLTMEANAGRQAEREANAECEQQRAVLVQAREALHRIDGYARHEWADKARDLASRDTTKPVEVGEVADVMIKAVRMMKYGESNSLTSQINTAAQAILSRYNVTSKE